MMRPVALSWGCWLPARVIHAFTRVGMALEVPSDSDASDGDKHAAALQFDEDLLGLTMPPPASPAHKVPPSSPTQTTSSPSKPGLGSAYLINAIRMFSLSLLSFSLPPH